MEAAGQSTPQALAALFSIAFLTEFGIPFPLVLDTVLFLVGFQAANLGFQPAAIVLVLLLGRVSGSALLYWVSHAAGGRVLSSLEYRFPRLGGRIESLQKKKGMPVFLSVMLSQLMTRDTSAGPLTLVGMRASSTVALARITPGLLTLTTVASGMTGLSYKYFALGIATTSVLVDGAEITLGVIMGYGIIYSALTSSPWLIVIGALTNLFLLWMLPRLIWRRPSVANIP